MRKIAAAIAILALLIAIAILSGRGPDRAALNPQSAPDHEVQVSPSDLADLNVPATESRAEAQKSEPSVAVTTDVPVAAVSTSPCIVFGRISDESGAPLVDVLVRLHAYKVWSDEVDVPRLESEWNIVGFEHVTDVTGEFRFEAPVPTNTVTRLDIEPTRFHDSHRVTFSSDRARYEPSLVEGERDLGEIRLSTTGAIIGRVVAASGTPLAGVHLDVGPDRMTTYSRSTKSEADGSYVLGHAPIGTYCIKAKSEGYLSGLIEPVTVEAKRDTVQVDFVLEEAPTIQGHVTNQEGITLKGARVSGWPEGSGAGAGATSGPDGRFTIYLPQDEPYSLECKLAGHEKWGGGRSTHYPPGTVDLEIVMNSLPLTRFLVLDSESREPLSEFGINILLDNGSKSPARAYTERWRPRPKRYDNGIAEVTARTGSDLYVIAAPGYGLASGDVRYDEVDVPLQTVLLVKGARVIGRLLRDGAPVAAATIELVAGDTFLDGEFLIDENSLFTARTNEAGQFELDGISAGTYRFIATPQEGAPLQLPNFSLALREVNDLGDLELPLSGASIEGEVLLPVGIKPAGLEVVLGAWQDGRSALVDSNGKFYFENLQAGEHSLRLRGRPGLLAATPSVEVLCVTGETQFVSIDARDRGVCEVSLTLKFGDLPLEGYIVEVANSANPLEDTRLGKCDAKGKVSGSARGWGDTIVQVWLPDGRTLEIPNCGLVLRAGEEIEQEIQREFGRVRVQLPDGIQLPSEGEITLDFESTNPEDGGAWTSLETRDHMILNASAWAGGSEGEIFVDGLPAGRLHVVLELVDSGPGNDLVTLGGGGDITGIDPTRSYRGEAEATLIIGEEVLVELN